MKTLCFFLAASLTASSCGRDLQQEDLVTATAPLAASRVPRSVDESIQALTATGAEVFVAKRNADGTVSRRCVGSTDEASSFFAKPSLTKAER